MRKRTVASAEVGETLAGLAPAAPTPRMRNLLERLEAAQLSSATLLRAQGRVQQARRAEQFGARIRLTLDEPAAARRMHARSERLRAYPERRLLFEEALDAAMSFVGGDLGNIQLSHRGSTRLRIAFAHGFDAEFLEHFAVVDDDSSVCGRAAQRGTQTVIADVRHDPAFAAHGEIAAASGFQAVQSTPVLGPAGDLRGMISTHFRRAHRPQRRDLLMLEWYAERLGAVLADRTPRPDAGSLH